MIIYTPMTLHHRPMMLMNLAYCVHGLIAPILPFAISAEKKESIRKAIEYVEEKMSDMICYSDNGLMNKGE